MGEQNVAVLALVEELFGYCSTAKATVRGYSNASETRACAKDSNM
jgi:hypothetical protein